MAEKARSRAERQFCRRAILGLALALACAHSAVPENTEPSSDTRAESIDDLTPIVLQLRWKHQFQFAGYYAAIARGYYRAAGFDVTPVEGSPEHGPVEEVLAGRAQYAVGNSEVLYERLHGKPLVALATIFQHSPSVLLARRDSGIRTPQDLVGRRVMLMGGTNDADLLAMFQNEGVSLDRIQRLDTSFDVGYLIAGKTDAFNAYITNEPYFLQQQGIEVSIIRPITYGIDFYSDILFTSEEEARRHPIRVRMFREATLRGWEYAMEHPGEIIDILLTKYGCQKTRAHLEFEAKEMRKLILPDLVEIGHMNPGRWERMANVFVQVGMADSDSTLEGFIYDPNPRTDLRWVWWGAGTVVALSLLLAMAAVWNRQLKRTVNERTAALRASEEKYRTLLENLPQRIFYKDRESRYVSCNPNYAEDLGITPEEIVGRTDYEFFPKELAENYRADDRRVIQERQVADIEEDIVIHGVRRNIHTVKRPVLDTRGDVMGVLGIYWDITERKRMAEEKRLLEAQVQHAQKLESLGVLAGGIAHDFNNLLMAVLGNTELAIETLPPMSPARENLVEIDRVSRRAADLCKQMLAYSGRGRFVIESLDLSALVGEMAKMLEVSISKRATLRYDFTRDLPAIEGDATQIRQVVMNLITNASDALGDQDGVITVKTGIMQCDAESLKDNCTDESVPEGPYVFIEVTDTGCGMSEETRQRLFEPFFTTKFTGRGLGLSAVLGIVRGHRGALKVWSETGKGTTFSVLLPASGKVDEHRDKSSGNVVPKWRGEGLVLLVDDEEYVRSIGERVLKRLGFDVITASDGEMAIEVLRAHMEDLVCVILDLTMPRMDGEQCFHVLREMKPDIRIVMSSGYHEQEIAERFAGKGLWGFIQKPYRIEELRAILERVLAGPSPIPSKRGNA